ncbi:MAG: SMP-30/gluconolactonase/LRE family protein [Actinomycetes bacterium]
MGKVAIDPQVWQPPPAPELAGVFARNDLLDRVELWPTPGAGPEDVVVDHAGGVVTGLEDGRVVRFDPEGSGPVQLTHTGGRPLGIELLGDDAVLVCDAERGLLRVGLEDGACDVLLDRVDRRPLVLTNNAAVGADGTVWFTESTRRHPLSRFRADILEHNGSGRLLRFDPVTGDVEEVLGGLSFANGVALAADGQSLVVAETGGYALHRVWLHGDRAGEREAFASNLPGFPDNLSTGSDGTIWCALPSLGQPALDALLPWPPALRKAVWRLPEAIQPDAVRVGFVVGFAPDGTVRHNLRSDGERFHYVTGVREHDGWLYLGSLVERAVARVRVPG